MHHVYIKIPLDRAAGPQVLIDHYNSEYVPMWERSIPEGATNRVQILHHIHDLCHVVILGMYYTRRIKFDLPVFELFIEEKVPLYLHFELATAS